MEFISENLVLIIIILAAVIFAVIGFIAEKKGYIGHKKQEDEMIDFSELSKPRDGEEKTKEEKPKEEDISKSFDEMPDFNTLPTIEKKDEPKEEVISDTDEDLYAPFGDQTFEAETKVEEKPKSKGKVKEVVSDDFKQSFVDVDKIEKESKDIKGRENKKEIADLMQDQGEAMNFDFEVEGAESEKKSELPTFEEVLVEEEKDKKAKEEEELKNMWNY